MVKNIQPAGPLNGLTYEQANQIIQATYNPVVAEENRQKQVRLGLESEARRQVLETLMVNKRAADARKTENKEPVNTPTQAVVSNEEASMAAS